MVVVESSGIYSRPETHRSGSLLYSRCAVLPAALRQVLKTCDASHSRTLKLGARGNRCVAVTFVADASGMKNS